MSSTLPNFSIPNPSPDAYDAGTPNTDALVTNISQYHHPNALTPQPNPSPNPNPNPNPNADLTGTAKVSGDGGISVKGPKYKPAKYFVDKYGMSSSTLRNWANDNKLQIQRSVGGKRFYSIESFDQIYHNSRHKRKSAQLESNTYSSSSNDKDVKRLQVTANAGRGGRVQKNPQNTARKPTSTVKHTKTSFIVEVELPGVDPTEIDVRLSMGNLCIFAIVRSSSSSAQNDGEKNRIIKKRIERPSGTYKRVLKLDSHSEGDDIVNNTYVDGLLTLVIAKKPPQTPNPNTSYRLPLV